ncbi:MAG: response regulator [Planctomycetes bacterium]|nr:response regulator [Planctomycetota bacterium]MCC7171789.1 response regulator [Planctomycetota bacterium]
MHIQDLTLQHLRRAVRLYVNEAYRAPGPFSGKQPRIEFEGADDARLMDYVTKAPFVDESKRSATGNRSFALRLGNSQYPFMKLLIAEHLVQDEFFFSVDTHDQAFDLDVDPKFCQIRAGNRQLKADIEAAWDGANLPTTFHMRGLVDGLAIERRPPNGLRILVVDDDQGIQDTFAQLLVLRGFDVDRANDGYEALELADATRHTAILMDVEMPRVTGTEALAELRADPARAKVPVILASAGAVEAAIAAKPYAVLSKPFHAEELFAHLDALLAARAIDPSR